MTGGASVVLIGTFLPWFSSGSVARSSYDLFGVIDRLGFSPGGPVGWAVRLWPLVPLLLVATVVVHHVGHARSGWHHVRFVTAFASGLYAGSVALAVTFAPDLGLARPRFGTLVTIVGVAVLGAAAVRSRLTVRRARPAAPPVGPS